MAKYKMQSADCKKKNAPEGVEVYEPGIDDLVDMLNYFRERYIKFELSGYSEEYRRRATLVCNEVFDKTISILKSRG